MKMLASFAVLLYLTACSKTAGSSKTVTSLDETLTAAVSGQWNLVYDSTFEGVGWANHAVDYTGEPGDYFNFSADGSNLYTKEGNVLDTLAYQLLSDSSVIITDFGTFVNGVPDTSTITGLTGSIESGKSPDTIVIESPFFLTPGGEFWRKVKLSR